MVHSEVSWTSPKLRYRIRLSSAYRSILDWSKTGIELLNKTQFNSAFRSVLDYYCSLSLSLPHITCTSSSTVPRQHSTLLIKDYPLCLCSPCCALVPRLTLQVLVAQNMAIWWGEGEGGHKHTETKYRLGKGRVGRGSGGMNDKHSERKHRS